jgi:hypothetical protein
LLLSELDDTELDEQLAVKGGWDRNSPRRATVLRSRNCCEASDGLRAVNVEDTPAVMQAAWAAVCAVTTTAADPAGQKPANAPCTPSPPRQTPLCGAKTVNTAAELDVRRAIRQLCDTR